MPKMIYKGSSVAAQFAEMKETLVVLATAMNMGEECALTEVQDRAAECICAAEAQETTLLELLNLEAGAEVPADPRTALQEKIDAQHAELIAAKEALAAAKEEHAQALADSEAAQETAQTAALEALQEKLTAAETLAEERGKKLENPAYKVASIEGQEPVETSATETEGGLYEQFSELKKSNPVAATKFWRANEAAIQGELANR